MAKTKVTGGYIADSAITSDHLHTTLDLSSKTLTIGATTVSGHLIPDTNITYDLGSSTYRFRDIYLDGTTINLGGTELKKNSDGDIEFKSGSNFKKLVISELEFDDGSNRKKFKIDGGRIKTFDSSGSSDTADKISLSANKTDDLGEGTTNLYFTTARARSSFSASTGIAITDGAISATAVPNSSLTNSSVTINSNSLSLGGTLTLDTDDIGEGSTNLYFTNARARGAISVSGNALSYNSSTGVLTANYEESPVFTGSITVGDSHTIGDDANDNLEIASSTGENILINSANQVYLQTGGTTKLETTSTGIDVTGVAVVDGLTSSAAITSTSNSNSLGGTTFTSAVSGTSLSLSASITASGNSNSFGNSSFGTISSGAITSTGAIQGASFSDGTISGITFIDEDSFATNSATRVPTQQSIKAYVDAQVAGVVDSAPAALNTLNELAAALGDDANFSTTTSDALGNRLRVDTASQGLTGTQQANAITNLGITATKAELNVLDGITATTTELNYTDGVTSNIQTQLNTKYASGSNPDFTGLNVNTSTATTPFMVSRNGSDNTQVVKVGIYDTIAEFKYIEDTSNEGSGNFGAYRFILGGNSGETDVQPLHMNKDTVTIGGDLNLTSGHQLKFNSVAVTASAAELNYLDGVTSNIQTQLDSKYESGDNVSLGTISSGAITSTGALTTSTGVIMNNGGDKYWMRWSSGSGTGIYYQQTGGEELQYLYGGSKKFGVTASGNATFTGTISSGAITAPSLNNSATITFNSTGNNPTVTLNRYSGQPSLKAGTDDSGYLIMDSSGGVAALNWYSSNNVVLALGGGNVGVGMSSGLTDKLNVSGGITASGTITASGGNSGNWNTAYGWGNHASAGYITNSTTQSNNIFIRGTSPTIYLRDTDHISSMIHQNSNLFYILRADSADDTGWTTYSTSDGANGKWPLEINLTNSGHYFNIGSTNVNAGGNTVWHAGNDGSGSGLDADTLDGEHAATFTSHGTLSSTADYQYSHSDAMIYTSFTRSSATSDTDQHGRHYYSGTGSHRTNFIPLDKTAAYRMKIRWKASAAAGTYIAVFLLDTSGNNITGSGTYWRYPWSGTNSPTSWTTNEYIYHASEMPSNAAYIAFGISHTNYNAGNSATYYVSQLELEKVPNTRYIASGGVSQYYTSSRNLRGYIGATETDDSHFVIATSGGEDIAFKDGGMSGTSNMIIRGNGDVYIPSVAIINQIKLGDGNDGYFYSDTNGRTAFTGGDFYIQSGVSNYYNYATNQYIGGSSGDSIYLRGNTMSGNSWTLTGAGAFTTSGVIDVNGGHGGLNITNSSILSSATSTWTGNPGGAGKIQYHSNRWYIVSDSSSNRIVQFRRDGTDVSYIANDGNFVGNVVGNVTGTASNADTVDNVHAASFLRSDAADTAGSKITFSTGLARSGHNVGHLEGSYNNVGGNSTNTNPIYTIGSNYNPGTTSLGNMYGIGYSHPNFWGSGKTSDWGMYVCTAGGLNATIGSGTTTAWFQNNVIIGGTLDTGQGATEVYLMNQNVRTSDGPTFAEVYNNGWFRSQSSGNGLYNTANANHFYSSNSSTWNINSSADGNTIALHLRRGYGGTVTGTLYGDTSNNFGLLSNDGSWALRVSNSEVHSYHDHRLETGTRNGSSIAVNKNFGYGFHNDSAGTGAYAIIREPGAWSSPYPDIEIKAHTGLSIGADDSYEGVRIFTDYNETTRVIQFNGSSNYIFKDVWMHTDAGEGMYSGHNGAHIDPNNSSTYGAWRILGSRNSYGGFYDAFSGNNTGMYDSGGNGGQYREGNRWITYYHVSNACLGIGGSTTSSSYGLYEQMGGIYSTNNIVAFSDRRVKENIVPIDNALEKVNALQGVYYNRIDDEEKKKEIGFIAQDVNEVTPELVTYAEDVDQYGVKYGNTTALLVEAIKELTQKVKELEKKLEEK